MTCKHTSPHTHTHIYIYIYIYAYIYNYIYFYVYILETLHEYIQIQIYNIQKISAPIKKRFLPFNLCFSSTLANVIIFWSFSGLPLLYRWPLWIYGIYRVLRFMYDNVYDTKGKFLFTDYEYYLRNFQFFNKTTLAEVAYWSFYPIIPWFICDFVFYCIPIILCLYFIIRFLYLISFVDEETTQPMQSAKKSKSVPCDRCGKISKPLKCGNCHVVMYCSKECQKIDWNAKHRFECK